MITKSKLFNRINNKHMYIYHLYLKRIIINRVKRLFIYVCIYITKSKKYYIYFFTVILCVCKSYDDYYNS